MIEQNDRKAKDLFKHMSSRHLTVIGKSHASYFNSEILFRCTSKYMILIFKEIFNM